MLRHAEHPNSRSAIVFPGPEDADFNKYEASPSKNDRTRLLLATNSNDMRGADQNGLDLAETTALTRKLAQMNATPGGRAVNLDGGGSSQMAVIEKAGTTFRRVELSIAPPKLIKPVTANFIAFSRKMDKLDS